MKLEFLQEVGVYRGNDPATKKSVTARKGVVVDVSEEKAAQLLKDFPKDWKKVSDDVKENPPVPEPVEKKGKKKGK